MTDAPLTYRVRVGDDGRWRHEGDNWLAANRSALELFASRGRAEIFAYRGDHRIGKRTLTVHPDPTHHSHGTPLIRQEGSMS